MTPVVLTRHILEAQRRVARRYAIDVHASPELARALTPPAPRWFEVEPHCSNEPLWKMFVARAIEQRAWRSNVEPAWLLSQAASSPLVADEIVLNAAGMLHEFAQRETIA
jgi:hypothetical protein